MIHELMIKNRINEIMKEWMNKKNKSMIIWMKEWIKSILWMKFKKEKKKWINSVNMCSQVEAGVRTCAGGAMHMHAHSYIGAYAWSTVQPLE